MGLVIRSRTSNCRAIAKVQLHLFVTCQQLTARRTPQIKTKSCLNPNHIQPTNTHVTYAYTNNGRHACVTLATRQRGQKERQEEVDEKRKNEG